MPLLAVLFWAAAFYVLGQFDFRTDPVLRLKVRVPQDDTFLLYYDSDLLPGGEKSLEAEVKSSEKFGLVSFALSGQAKPARVRITLGEKAGDAEMKSITLKGFLSSRTWLPGDIVRDFSMEHGSFVLEDEGRTLKIAGAGGGPALSYAGDFSVPYGEVRAGMARWMVPALWATVLSVMFLLTYRFTSFFRVRIAGRSAFDIALSAVFIVFLVLPTAREHCYRSKRRSSMHNIEKRALTPKPDFKIAKIFYFPGEFDRYYNDNFSFRRKLIRWHNRLKARYLKISPLRDNVVLGKEGWLFYTAENVLKDYDGSLQFTEEELAKVKDNLLERRDWLRERGAAFYVLVAPNKHTIYSEYLPDYVKKVNGRSRLDNLIEYLRTNSDIEIIDVRDELMREKSVRRLYYKLDTHWNQYGAFIAYQKLIKSVARDFPPVKPLLVSDFGMSSATFSAGDLSVMLAISDELDDESVALHLKGGKSAREAIHLYDEANSPSFPRGLTREGGRKDLPSLVMFRDSFGEGLIQFLSENFRRSVYVGTHNFPVEVIEEEKPDIVIHELVERKLHDLLLDNPESVRAAYAARHPRPAPSGQKAVSSASASALRD